MHKTKTTIGLAIAAAFGVATPAHAQKTADRNAYFGQTHTHTSWSMDAYLIGNHITDAGRRVQVFDGAAGQAPGRLRRAAQSVRSTFRA